MTLWCHDLWGVMHKQAIGVAARVCTVSCRECVFCWLGHGEGSCKQYSSSDALGTHVVGLTDNHVCMARVRGRGQLGLTLIRL